MKTPNLLRSAEFVSAVPNESNDTAVCDDFVTVSVSDNGSGMDETTRERLFELYFTTKAEGQGTGLGLAQVYGLMLQLDGRVDVVSELGKGTTFTLMFCRVAGEAQSKEKQAMKMAN